MSKKQAKNQKEKKGSTKSQFFWRSLRSVERKNPRYFCRWKLPQVRIISPKFRAGRSSNRIFSPVRGHNDPHRCARSIFLVTDHIPRRSVRRGTVRGTDELTNQTHSIVFKLSPSTLRDQGFLL